MILTQKVKVSLGATVKLNPEDPKGFEFLRLDVGYERDIPYREDRKKAYEDAWSIVEEELTGAISEMREKVNNAE